MKDILDDNNLPKPCTFIFPSLLALLALKERGLGFLLDMLHFFPLEAIGLYNKRGPCSLAYDDFYECKVFQMECLNLAYHEFKALEACDPKNAPATFEEYVACLVMGMKFFSPVIPS